MGKKTIKTEATKPTPEAVMFDWSFVSSGYATTPENWFKKEWIHLRQRKWNVVMTAIALGFAAYCLFVVPSQSKDDDATKAVFLGLWTIGIPAFFFLAWYFATEHDEKGAEYGQKFWLAVASFLTLIYFGDHLKNPTREDLGKLQIKVQEHRDEVTKEREKLEAQLKQLKEETTQERTKLEAQARQLRDEIQSLKTPKPPKN
jgi:hypothetical protein